MMTSAQIAFFRLAASGLLPPSLFGPTVPAGTERAARSGRLRIEVVTHCWAYSHFLAYQLSSLVLFPPQDADITVTVFFSPEDRETVQVLDYFDQYQVPGVSWNWQSVSKNALFRRGIGRNRAALETKADWVWFTDCDVMFRQGCFDSLAHALQGRRDTLVYPEREHATDLLGDESPLIRRDAAPLQLQDVDPAEFAPRPLSKATGPFQITHGDVCRAVGYCRDIRVLQAPAEKFAKCHEDRVYRWLLQSSGTAVPVQGVYRLRHASKGRYGGRAAERKARMWIRSLQARLK